MEFLKQYRVLYKKAKSDLNVAKILWKKFESGEVELDLTIIMFHLQQSAEKLLKALLAYNSLHYTKTHSIEKLIEVTETSNINLSKNIEKLIPLSDFAVEGRYSIILDDIEDVESHFEILDDFIIFVKKAIK